MYTSSWFAIFQGDTFIETADDFLVWTKQVIDSANNSHLPRRSISTQNITECYWDFSAKNTLRVLLHLFTIRVEDLLIPNTKFVMNMMSFLTYTESWDGCNVNPRNNHAFIFGRSHLVAAIYVFSEFATLIQHIFAGLYIHRYEFVLPWLRRSTAIWLLPLWLSYGSWGAWRFSWPCWFFGHRGGNLLLAKVPSKLRVQWRNLSKAKDLEV